MYEQQFNPYAANVEIVKGYLKSGKVLFLGILHLISLALTVVTLLTQPVTVSVTEYLNQLSDLGVDTSEFSYYSDSFMNGFTAGTVVGTVVSSVFTILTAVAFIVIFAKSRSNNPDSNPSAGVGILRVLSVISFVCTIILTVFVGLFFVILVIASGSVSDYLSTNTEATTAVLIILGVLLVLVMFFLLFTTAACKNFYRSVKYSLNTVQLQTKGALAYGVLNIIFAVFSGLGLIGTAVMTFSSISLSSLLLLGSSVVSFLILLFTASLALGYNSYINRQKFGYHSTPYGGAPNAAYVPADHNGQNPYAAPSQNNYSDNYQNYNIPQQGAPSYNDNFSDYNAAVQEKRAFCPNCGAPVDGSAPFCSNCGFKL